MLLSAVSVLVVALSSSEIPEGLMNNPVHTYIYIYLFIYLLQLGCYPVAVVILHVNKTLNWLLLDLSQEGCMRSM